MFAKSEIHEVELLDDRPPHEVVESYIRDLESSRDIKAIGWGGISYHNNKIALSVSIIPKSLNIRSIDKSAATGAARYRGIKQGGVALILPTGVGASRGGYIGDFTPVIKLYESVFDNVYTNPNAVNGGDYYDTNEAYYVDGYSLDSFLQGSHSLTRSKSNRIGVILDNLPENTENSILNSINASRVVSGIDVIGYKKLASKLLCKTSRHNSGYFLGEIDDIAALLNAANILIKNGATALAIVSDISGVQHNDWKQHYSGNDINPIGSTEALISRLLTYSFGVPTAHAPAYLRELESFNEIVDPRAAPEVASKTGLNCVLKGLARAPKPTLSNTRLPTDLEGIVVPKNCSLGTPLAASQAQNIPLILVRDNDCKIGIDASLFNYNNLVIVENYAEALSWLIAQRAGIEWNSIIGKIKSVSELN